MPFLQTLLTQLLRPVCPGCEQFSALGELCLTCQQFMPGLAQACKGCGRPMLTDLRCGHCLQKPEPWTQIHVAWEFSGLCRFLIHRFKYHQDYAAGNALVTLWQRTLSGTVADAAITAVPMHPDKRWSKGFNHAQWLAQRLSQQLGLPRWQGVQRVRNTQPLEGLSKQARKVELKNAFALRQPPPAQLILVDDVLTTGATLRELSHCLQRGGCVDVSVWVLARTPLP